VRNRRTSPACNRPFVKEKIATITVSTHRSRRTTRKEPAKLDRPGVIRTGTSRRGRRNVHPEHRSLPSWKGILGRKRAVSWATRGEPRNGHVGRDTLSSNQPDRGRGEKESSLKTQKGGPPRSVTARRTSPIFVMHDNAVKQGRCAGGEPPLVCGTRHTDCLERVASSLRLPLE